MQAARFSGIDLHQILPATVAAKPRNLTNGLVFALHLPRFEMVNFLSNRRSYGAFVAKATVKSENPVCLYLH